MSKLQVLTATALVTALAVSAGYAQQQQQTQRLAGTIEKVDGSTVIGKGRDGSPVTIKLPDNVVVTAVFKATVADIKPGAYIGSGATPQADGSQKAVEVHIFAESMRGQGDGHRPGWYGTPNGTMQMERLPNPKGDRVKITMSGKFLPFKYYGNSGNVPEYGFKEG